MDGICNDDGGWSRNNNVVVCCVRGREPRVMIDDMMKWAEYQNILNVYEQSRETLNLI